MVTLVWAPQSSWEIIDHIWVHFGWFALFYVNFEILKLAVYEAELTSRNKIFRTMLTLHEKENLVMDVLGPENPRSSRPQRVKPWQHIHLEDNVKLYLGLSRSCVRPPFTDAIFRTYDSSTVASNDERGRVHIGTSACMHPKTQSRGT